MQRIIGGEICEIDEFPWAALLLYESSRNLSHSRCLEYQIKFLVFSIETTNATSSACGGVLLNKRYVLTAGEALNVQVSTSQKFSCHHYRSLREGSDTRGSSDIEVCSSR